MFLKNKKQGFNVLIFFRWSVAKPTCLTIVKNMVKHFDTLKKIKTLKQNFLIKKH
jgi:hypothetical protein